MNRNAYELILDAASVLRKTHVAGSTRSSCFPIMESKSSPARVARECKCPLGWIQDAIVATGAFEIRCSSYWTNKTLETVEPERWKEIVATKGLIGFLTYNPARISVLRDKIEAAGGTPGDVRFFRSSGGRYGAPALHSAGAC